MGKFNKSQRGNRRVETYEGAEAVIPHKKETLVRQVLTTFVSEPKFYMSANDAQKALVSIARKIVQEDPKFISQLANYVRNEMHMRSISHLLAAELAYSKEGKTYIRNLLPKITHRPDDMTEILAYYLNTYGKPIPNALKKGLADSFVNFNEYQLQKYNKKTQVTLKDIICLAHPKPENKEQSDMWKRLLEDRLETPYTWETELSKKGNTKEVWEELIDSGKVGYMAMLRNLRNILETNPYNIQFVIDNIQDPEKVKKSKQLPFRFYAAYHEISSSSVSYSTTQVLEALEKAIDYSVQNLDVMPGKTVLAADDSGSMCYSRISRNSTITPAQIAGLMMSISHSLCEEVICGSFSNNFRIRNINSNNSILANTKYFVKDCEAGGTYTQSIFETLHNSNIKADRIIIFSDDQAAGFPQEVWERYKREISENTWLHMIDIAGYRTEAFRGEKITYTPGWSEKTLKFINLVEKGENNIIQEIENYGTRNP